MNCNSVYSNDYIAPAIWRPVATPPVLVAPNASVVTNHVPVTIKDHTAYAHVLVGGIETTSIVYFGMTFMNVNTSVADRLMASGQAKRWRLRRYDLRRRPQGSGARHSHQNRHHWC